MLVTIIIILHKHFISFFHTTLMRFVQLNTIQKTDFLIIKTSFDNFL